MRWWTTLIWLVVELGPCSSYRDKRHLALEVPPTVNIKHSSLFRYDATCETFVTIYQAARLPFPQHVTLYSNEPRNSLKCSANVD